MISLHNNFVAIFFAIILLVLIAERIVFNLSSKNKTRGKIYYPWLTTVPFVAYIFIVIIVLLDAFVIRGEISAFFALFGILLYGVGAFLRRASQQALGDLWSMQIEIKPHHSIIKSGIYRYFRHPYSAAVLLELVGFSMIFQSWIGFICVLLIQWPLLLVRNRTEDNILGKHVTDSRLEHSTILGAIKQFGIGALFEFIAINNAMKHYNRYYMLTNCMMALLNVGFFDELQRCGVVNIRHYAKDRKLNFSILNTICGYLMAQGILEKRGKMVRTTRRGIFLSDKCRGIFDFISAYEPIFDNLEGMLEGKVNYGKDIFRQGKYVAAASAHLAKRFTFPIVRSVIAKHNFSSILDLGCGSGEFLETLTDLPDVPLFGIDISKEALDYAKLRLKQNNIRLEVCDMFDLDKLQKIAVFNGAPPAVITSVFVLHEFASEGFSKLVSYLSTLRENFPQSRLLIYELFWHKWHKLRKNSSAIREHHLFHFLSNQNLLSIGNWQNVFRDSGYSIEEQKVFDKFGQGYFLLRP